MPLVNIPGQSYVECDKCGAKTPPYGSSTQAEREAERAGWKVSIVPGKTLCPKHVEEAADG